MLYIVSEQKIEFYLLVEVNFVDKNFFSERNTNILIYVKRRLGMCARRLGKLREATKIFRDLVKEFPMMSVFNIHENLIEVLLALQNYPDVQGVLAKYDGKSFNYF